MRHLRTVLITATFCLFLDRSSAVEFEAVGKSVAKVLGTTKAFKATVQVKGQPTTVFYSKDGSGRPQRLAVVQKGIYEPDCTHTWIVGLTAGSATVTEVRVVEMSCPHAFPTREATFLRQYKGRSPASLSKLDGDIHTVAKATGSSELTTDAVKKSILAAKEFGNRN